MLDSCYGFFNTSKQQINYAGHSLDLQSKLATPVGAMKREKANPCEGLQFIYCFFKPMMVQIFKFYFGCYLFWFFIPLIAFISVSFKKTCCI